MRRSYFKIIEILSKEPNISQRKMAKILGFSGAYVNKLLFKMEREKLLTRKGIPVLKLKVSEHGRTEYENCKVTNAIIFADSVDKNFVPITYSKPRGLIEVNNQRIIERQIMFLHEQNIYDITLVVGYLKEQYEYLIDKYKVKLVYNSDYNQKTLTSLIKVKDLLDNTYITSSATYMRENIFYDFEPRPYLVFTDTPSVQGKSLTLGKLNRITGIETTTNTKNTFEEGFAYFDRKFSNKIKKLLENIDINSKDSDYTTLIQNNIKDLEIYAREVNDNMILYIDNIEQLRKYDEKYLLCSHDKCMKLITSIFQCTEADIVNIKPQKIGMTNKSFLFDFKGEKYIFRMPGEGTELLINRSDEYTSYQAIKDLKFSDVVVYFNPAQGYKITKFLNNCHNSDSTSEKDIKESVKLIRKLHDAKKIVPHCFDLKERINFYDKIAKNNNGIFYEDYNDVKAKMFKLIDNLNNYNIEKCLCHIDFIYDNILTDGEKYHMIDWEYSAMADPYIDLAMYSIYAYYEQDQVDKIIKVYLDGNEPSLEEKIRVYSYIAISGFLWAIWVIYKQSMGVEFGDYGMKMYRYAKDYYQKVMDLLS